MCCTGEPGGASAGAGGGAGGGEEGLPEGEAAHGQAAETTIQSKSCLQITRIVSSMTGLLGMLVKYSKQAD